MSIDTDQLNTCVQVFVTNTSQVQGAALVTPDGLPLAAALPSSLEESRAAAMAAAVITLGDRISHELQRGAAEHILLEGSEGYSILTRCGPDALLLVLANRDMKQGILMLEIRRVVADLIELLAH